MDVNEINKQERERLIALAKEESDEFHKSCLIDDLLKLESHPEQYWSHFNIEAFEPVTVVETQRLNTITAMQKHYSK
jgi:hypothetical protein